MGDSKGESALSLTDFLVTICSFCALSREEVLQLQFIIMDASRNGHVKREEIEAFFSYVPVGSGGKASPVFPLNNKNSLDKFRHGKWTCLEFDGLSQLCEYFPYISYPAYHTQDLFRTLMLGKSFWEAFDQERAQILRGLGKSKKVIVPGTGGKVKADIKIPGRVTMQELLEYSRRKTAVSNGKRVESQSTGKHSSKLTKERDDQIARCPILTLIRNPRCMYHVPKMQTQGKLKQAGRPRPEFELPDASGHVGGRSSVNTPKGVIATPKSAPDFQNELVEEEYVESEESENSSESSYDSEEDDEYDDEDDTGPDRAALPPPPEPNLPLPPP